jgi:hypothetical protein
MMGWLNKAMDALGVALEEATASEVTGVIAPSGWMPGQHRKGAILAGNPPSIAPSIISSPAGVIPGPRCTALNW